MFCPFNCAGKGICTYKEGEKLPTCECFDPNDKSLGCTGSSFTEETPTLDLPNCLGCSGGSQGPCQRKSDKVCFSLADPSEPICPLGSQLCPPQKKVPFLDDEDDYKFYDSNAGRGNLKRLRRNLVALE